jgi:hypothetical protein
LAAGASAPSPEIISPAADLADDGREGGGDSRGGREDLIRKVEELLDHDDVWPSARRFDRPLEKKVYQTAVCRR